MVCVCAFHSFIKKHTTKPQRPWFTHTHTHRNKKDHSQSLNGHLLSVFWWWWYHSKQRGHVIFFIFSMATPHLPVQSIYQSTIKNCKFFFAPFTSGPYYYHYYRCLLLLATTNERLDQIFDDW